LRLPLSLGVTVIAAHCAWPGRHAGERDVESDGAAHGANTQSFTRIFLR